MYKLIADDLEKVLNEAKSMGCNNVAAFRHIPLENVQTVVTALQKQVPMKPTFQGDGYADDSIVYDTWICPNCGKDYEVEYDEYKYCPECGQKIDWTEVK